MEFRTPDEGVPPPLPPMLSPAELAKLPHDNLGPTVLGTTWTFVTLSLSFILLRVYCKFARHRALWWDDYILIASWVCTGEKKKPIPHSSSKDSREWETNVLSNRWH